MRPNAIAQRRKGFDHFSFSLFIFSQDVTNELFQGIHFCGRGSVRSL